MIQHVKHLAQYLEWNKFSLSSSTLRQKQNMALLLLIATKICQELCKLQLTLTSTIDTLSPTPISSNGQISDLILQKKKRSEGSSGSRSNGKKVSESEFRPGRVIIYAHLAAKHLGTIWLCKPRRTVFLSSFFF